MEVQLDDVWSEIHKVLSDCGCTAIYGGPESRVDDDHDTVKGKIQTLFRTKNDRHVQIIVRIHDEWSSVSIDSLGDSSDETAKIAEHERFRGGNAIEQVFGFIKSTLLEP